MYWVNHQSNSEEKYKTLLPDTTCWTRFSAFNANVYQAYYLRKPNFREYPVVGINYQQAVEYCKWRSKMVNLHIYLSRNKSVQASTDLKTPEYVRYRLPTKEEWEYAASAGLSFCNYPMGYERLTDKNNTPVSNTLEYFSFFKNNYKNTAYQCGDTLEMVYATEKVFFGAANKYGLYNMLGNVSELVQDSLVKGLNYYEPLMKLTPENRDTIEGVGTFFSTTIYNYKLNKKFTQPEPWIGFRCVCEVLEK